MGVRKRIWKTATGETKQAWVVDYADQSGKRRLKTFDRKKEADEVLALTRVEVKRGTHTPDSQSVTVDRAAELWLTTCENNGLERSTIDAYRQHANLHILPYLGRVKLSQLTAPQVRDFEDKLRRGDPASVETKGHARSPAMARKIIVSFGTMLADAQERGLVSRNVVRELRSNRRRGQERRADRRQKGRLTVGKDIPTRDEVKAIVGSLAGRWRPLILTAIFTGLRASELRGLRWSDIEFEKGELHVRQRADFKGVIGAPKSETSERAVPVPPLVMGALKEWQSVCPKGQLGLVFPNGVGNVESHANIVKRGLQPVQVTAGVVTDGVAKYPGLHSLRHFYASWCINRVVDGGLALPAKVVQERLGHSTIVLTMDRYGHLFPRGDDGAELAAAELALLG